MLNKINERMNLLFGTNINKLYGPKNKEYKFIGSGNEYMRVQNVLKKLNVNISSPRGFHYKIYLIDTAILNAFTFGGKIFITTKMLTFCKNNDELASWNEKQKEQAQEVS